MRWVDFIIERIDSATVLPILLDAAIKGMAVLALTALAALAMRRASAAARHLVWLLGTVSLLVLPVLSAALPGWHVLPRIPQLERVGTPTLQASLPTVPAQPTPAPAAPAPSSVDQQDPGQNMPDFGRVGPGEQRPTQTATAAPPAPAPAAALSAETPAPAAHPAGSAAPVRWAAWIVLIWLAGAAALLGRVMLGSVSLALLQRSAQRLTGGAWMELLQRLSAQLGLRRPVRLLSSSRRSMPMTWGLWRTRLLLPVDAGEWPAEQRQAVLLHELAHVKRWDCLTQLIFQLACALHWFNPLAWVAWHRMQTERERACDDLVLSTGAKASAYAEQLLQIASEMTPVRFSAAAIAMARPSKLEGRLLAILDMGRNRRALTWLATAVLLLATGVIAVPIAMLRAAAQETRATDETPATREQAAQSETTIRGRVLDQKGQPVSAVRVWASAGALGENFLWAQSELLVTHSDADGRFLLNLPFPELRYMLGTQKMGYSSAWQAVLPDTDREVELRIDAGQMDQQVTGRIRSESGQAASDVPLKLLGEFDFSTATKSDRSGAFAFTRLPDYIGGATIWAKSEGKVLPLAAVPAFSRVPVELQLVAPGRLEGTVSDQQSGKPIEGAVITARPHLNTGFSLRTKSDVQGHWQIEDVPPGDYLIEPEAPDHFSKPPRGYSFERDPHRAAAGATAKVDLQLSRKAIIAGSVVDATDRPIGGAMVCTLVTWNGDYRNQYRWVTTDSQGRFEIKTGHVEESLTLAVAHGQHGLAQVTLKPLGEGGREDNLRVVLPGMMRVRGIVRAADGKPVAGVSCEASWTHNHGAITDEEGRFDLGNVSLVAGHKAYVLSLKPPRPSRGLSVFSDEDRGFIPATQEGVKQERFFEPAHKNFTAKSDEVVDLPIELKQTDLLVIQGQIVNLLGDPVPRASAHVFAGTPDEGWVDQAIPRMTNSISMTQAKLLGAAVADEEGRFRVFVLRCEGEQTDNATRYAVGVVADNKPRKLVTNALVPVGKRELSLRIPVDPAVELKRDPTASDTLERVRREAALTMLKLATQPAATQPAAQPMLQPAE